MIEESLKYGTFLVLMHQFSSLYHQKETWMVGSIGPRRKLFYYGEWYIDLAKYFRSLGQI